MSSNNISNQKNHKQYKPSALAKGTVLYSPCDYNGINLEYHIFQLKGDLYQLEIYFRMIDFSKDYIFGITLNPLPINVEQQIFHAVNGEIINRIPRIRKDNIVLLDGVKNLLKPNAIGALQIILKLPSELKQFDFWINAKGELKNNQSYCVIPNLVDFKPPKLGKSITEAYPEFPSQDWWKYPLSQNITTKSKKPVVEWDNSMLFQEAETNESDSVQSDEDSWRELSENLKALELTDIKLKFNNSHFNLSLNNPGNKLYLTILTQYQAYQILVPAKTELSHQIESLGPIQVYIGQLDQGNNTLLIEDLRKILSIDFVECLDGVWIYWNNQSVDQELNTLVEVFHNGKFWKNHEITCQEKSHNKNLIDLPMYGIYLLRVFVKNNNSKKPISQYEFIRTQPKITLSSLENNNQIIDQVTIMSDNVIDSSDSKIITQPEEDLPKPESNQSTDQTIEPKKNDDKNKKPVKDKKLARKKETTQAKKESIEAPTKNNPDPKKESNKTKLEPIKLHEESNKEEIPVEPNKKEEKTEKRTISSA